jgi:hypothetical protein
LSNDHNDLSVALALIDRLALMRRVLVKSIGETRVEVLEDMEACAQLLALTLQPLVESAEARLLPANGGAQPHQAIH